MLSVRHTPDTAIEVGIDEAGRGCLWGPLFAAAVVWIPEDEMTPEQLEIGKQIRDSKKLTHKKRLLLYGAIQDLSLSWGVGRVEPDEIDRLGMTRSNQLAFERALEQLSIQPERLLIDGCISIYEAPWSMIEQIVEPEADNRYLPVAAASILAKVSRDLWIEEYAKTHPTIISRYDLSSSKGYGTKKHRDAILVYGQHSLHRSLFLRKLFAKEESQKVFSGDQELEEINH